MKLKSLLVTMIPLLTPEHLLADVSSHVQAWENKAQAKLEDQLAKQNIIQRSKHAEKMARDSSGILVDLGPLGKRFNVREMNDQKQRIDE